MSRNTIPVRTEDLGILLAELENLYDLNDTAESKLRYATSVITVCRQFAQSMAKVTDSNNAEIGGLRGALSLTLGTFPSDGNVRKFNDHIRFAEIAAADAKRHNKAARKILGKLEDLNQANTEQCCGSGSEQSCTS